MILNAVFYKSYIIGLFLRLSEQKVAGAQAKDILNRCQDLFPYLNNEAIAKNNIPPDCATFELEILAKFFLIILIIKI